jgi:hypothetical protein
LKQPVLRTAIASHDRIFEAKITNKIETERLTPLKCAVTNDVFLSLPNQVQVNMRVDVTSSFKRSNRRHLEFLYSFVFNFISSIDV